MYFYVMVPPSSYVVVALEPLRTVFYLVQVVGPLGPKRVSALRASYILSVTTMMCDDDGGGDDDDDIDSDDGDRWADG